MGYYPAVPKTMEQMVKELFNPPDKKPFYKGYEPRQYIKRVSPFRSDTKDLYEPQ